MRKWKPSARRSCSSTLPRAQGAQVPTSENAVKLNVASVLREDALYKDKQMQEAKMIKKYESELRANDYFRWKTEMEKKDHEAKMAEVERRRQSRTRARSTPRRRSGTSRRTTRSRADPTAGRAMTEQHEAEKELVLMTNKQLVTEGVRSKSCAAAGGKAVTGSASTYARACRRT